MSDDPRGLTLGASENLTKPVDRQAVVSAVARLLDGVAEREPTVLVVDDEPDGAELIRDTLRAEGFRTLVAHDGRQAHRVDRPEAAGPDRPRPHDAGACPGSRCSSAGPRPRHGDDPGAGAHRAR